MPRKKPFEYKIDDLLSDHNQDLYNDVSSQIEIILKKQIGTWSAHIDEDNKAIIGYNKSDWADASFAHELLHIKYELLGLKDPYIRSSEKDVDHSLIRYLINHLAHHKFYQEFYDLGFNEEEFLHDQDVIESKLTLKRDVPKLEKISRDLKEPLDGMAILLPYLICISPNETSEEFEVYKSRIVKIAKPEFIAKIDEIFSEWVDSERLDYSLSLARIFKACGLTEISFAPQNDIDNPISASDDI